MDRKSTAKMLANVVAENRSKVMLLQDQLNIARDELSYIFNANDLKLPNQPIMRPLLNNTSSFSLDKYGI